MFVIVNIGFGFGFHQTLISSKTVNVVSHRFSRLTTIVSSSQSQPFFNLRLSSISPFLETNKLKNISLPIIQHLPNILTVARILAIPPFTVAFIQDKKTLSSLIYLIASLTDLFDGWIARKFNVVSSFGAFLDPVADKVCSVYNNHVLSFLSKCKF